MWNSPSGSDISTIEPMTSCDSKRKAHHRKVAILTAGRHALECELSLCDGSWKGWRSLVSRASMGHDFRPEFHLWLQWLSFNLHMFVYSIPHTKNKSIPVIFHFVSRFSMFFPSSPHVSKPSCYFPRFPLFFSPFFQRFLLWFPLDFARKSRIPRRSGPLWTSSWTTRRAPRTSRRRRSGPWRRRKWRPRGSCAWRWRRGMICNWLDNWIIG